MKFKQTFHVFVDNFNIIYKQLLYRLVILVIAGVICTLGVYPFVQQLINSAQLNELLDSATDFILKLLNGEVAELKEISDRVQAAYAEFISLLNNELPHLVLGGLLILLVHIVSRWFMGLGNYATAAVINDRMALRANQPFLSTLIRTLRESAVYNVMYVPLSIFYDLAVAALMLLLLVFLLKLPVFICIFLFVLAIIVSIIIKMTFTTDWLPALIRGKKGQLGSFRYTFSQRGKKTLNVMSNYCVLTLTIFAVNAAALMLTLGVGLLISVPSSYVVLICFEFVNYYDREGLKYFIDDKTIISTAGEKPLTRETFFKGDED